MITRRYFQRFNTQPPEGGCLATRKEKFIALWFQHTATRRWLQRGIGFFGMRAVVSTHSHPKVAASTPKKQFIKLMVSTHSHPKVAAPRAAGIGGRRFCFNTQPPEGGCSPAGCGNTTKTGFNTQPPEGGCSLYKKMIKISRLFTVFRYSLKHKEWEGV